MYRLKSTPKILAKFLKFMWKGKEIWTAKMTLKKKEMETQSSVRAWRIPGMEEPYGLLSMGLHRVGHDWTDLATAGAHVSKVMLKILQVRLQQYMNHELPDVQVDLEKAEEPEIKLPVSTILSKRQENSRKNIYFCFIDCVKAFDCVDHNKLWKILKEMGIPDHLTCILRNLYAGQEAIVRIGHGTTGSK